MEKVRTFDEPTSLTGQRLTSSSPFGRWSRWCSAVVGMKEAGQKRLKEGKAEDAYIFLFRVPLYYSKVRCSSSPQHGHPPHLPPPPSHSRPLPPSNPRSRHFACFFGRPTETARSLYPRLRAWVNVETSGKA